MAGWDATVAAIARRQHGVIARRQLLAAGISDDWIAQRLGKGSLIRVFPGVYRVGHAAPSVEATYMAAVLACGEGAVLGGRAAASLLGLIPGDAPNARPASDDHHALARHPGHNTRPHPGRLGRVVSARRPRPRHASGGRPAQDDARPGRSGPHPEADHQGSRQAPRSHLGRPGPHPEQARASLHQAPQGEQAPAANHNRPANARFVDCRWPEHKLTVEHPQPTLAELRAVLMPV